MMDRQIEALSALNWWRDAGVDTLVDEEPRDWLRAPARAQPAASPAPAPSSSLPETIADFRHWLGETDRLPGAPGRRILPAGEPASGLMILADMPDRQDMDAGMLFSGRTGRLFDAMLAAIGRDRASVYLAPMAGVPVARPELDEADLHRILRHHVRLAAPRLLLLLGDAPNRALLGMGFNEARGRQHAINHDGGTVPAIATFPVRHLFDQPAHKAHAWADLRLVMGILGA